MTIKTHLLKITLINLSTAITAIEKIKQFLELVDVITFEFENIPFDSLNLMNNQKSFANLEIIKILQNRLLEKDFLNNLKIVTTKYVSIKKKRI